MDSLTLREVIRCDVWSPTVVLQIENGDNQELISLPSGVTKSVYGLDIDVNIQGNNILGFGPYFYKDDNVRMFDMASHRDLPMAGFLGNLQCNKNKTCIIAEDSCKCSPSTHQCLRESTNYCS